jgi:methyltransferase family protein
MAYHGLITTVKQYIHQRVPQERAPTILEVGIDRGVSMIPLVVFLARTREAFAYVGVDIFVQEQVQVMLSHMDLTEHQQAYCAEGNSIEALPKMVEQGMKFDVVLLDGDHNYHTVAEELKHIEALTFPESIIIIDDYDGRWSERDLWYAERPGYEDNKLASKKVETEKHGVKPAVDEWLETHPEWQKFKPVPGEPVLLMRKVI